MTLTDAQANALYDDAWCDGPSIFGPFFDDDERADNAARVRAMIAAPDLDAAMSEIADWESYCTSGNSNRPNVERLRALAGRVTP